MSEERIMTSHDLARDLQKLAEHLLAETATILPESTSLRIYAHNKETFVAAARVMPRPLKKEVDEDSYFFNLSGAVGCLKLDLSVVRSEVCRLVEPARPAVYDCVPLLSVEEESELAS